MQNTNAAEKKTQTEYFVEIANFVALNGGDPDWVTFLNGRADLLQKQAAKAKERKAKKNKPEDTLLTAVASCLGEKLKTSDEICEELVDQFPEISRNKVVARVKTLIETGVAGKISVNVGQGKRKVAYALAEYMPKDED